MKVLRKERFYAVEPAVVWEALTSPAALAEWLMPNNFRAVKGAEFEFLTDPTPVCGSGRTKCQVIDLEEQKRMTWSWTRDAGKGEPTPPMFVTWTLHREKEGTRLILEQTGLEAQGWLIRIAMSLGWYLMLKKSFRAVLNNVELRDGRARFRVGAIPLKKRYYTAKTVPTSFLEHPTHG